MSDTLEQLLRHADEAAALPPDQAAAEMAGSIRALARRRRFVRTTRGASVVAVLVVLLSVLFASRPEPAPPIAGTVTPPASPEEAEHALASLNAEAEARMAIVERLTKTEHGLRFVTLGPAPDPLLAIRREQDKAAYLLIFEADRLARRADERQRAAEEYRRVLALFPQTHWASVARDRLTELNSSSHAPGMPTNQEMS